VLYAFRLSLRFHPVAALDAAIVLCKTPFQTITLLICFTMILAIRVHWWCLGCECMARKTTKHSNNDEHCFHTAFHVSPSDDACSLPAFARFAFIRAILSPRIKQSILECTQIRDGLCATRRTSALGHKRSFNPIIPQCLLSGLKRPFIGY